MPNGIDALDDASMAAQYGLALNLLNSDPELKSLFQSAVAETWTPQQFTAKLQNSGWYKNNSENVRSALTLKQTDPATYGARLERTKESLYATALSMGAKITSDQLNTLADQAFTFGWSDQQLQTSLRNYIDYQDGSLYGQAKQFETDLRDYARQMGVRVPEATILSWVKTATQQGGTDGMRGSIMQMAQSAFPTLSERIKNGETVENIASAYKSSMADVLELNPEDVTLFDPTIRTALAGRDKDGNPATQSIWEFENGLRKDGRWRKTKGAQDAAMETTNKVLKDFGVIS